MLATLPPSVHLSNMYLKMNDLHTKKEMVVLRGYLDGYPLSTMIVNLSHIDRKIERYD